MSKHNGFVAFKFDTLLKIRDMLSWVPEGVKIHVDHRRMLQWSGRIMAFGAIRIAAGTTPGEDIIPARYSLSSVVGYFPRPCRELTGTG